MPCAPALVVLKHQVDHRWPSRRKDSDGCMGDAAHRRRRSSHNEGNALDLTLDLAAGPNLELLVRNLADQMRRYPTGRLHLIIFDRLIAGEGNHWTWSPYRGPNPHTTHAHIELRPEMRNVTRPWSLTG